MHIIQLNQYTKYLPLSIVAPEGIGLSGVDLAGEVIRCHSLSSSSPRYQETLSDILQYPRERNEMTMLGRRRLFYLT
jgi:hypothetical protein